MKSSHAVKLSHKDQFIQQKAAAQRHPSPHSGPSLMEGSTKIIFIVASMLTRSLFSPKNRA